MGPSRITWFQREADFHQRLNPTPFPGSKCPTLLAPLNLSKSCFAGAPGDQPGGAALCPGRHHWRGAEEHEAFPPFSPTATCLANRIAEYCPSGLNHVRKRVFLLIVLSPFLDQISAVAGAAFFVENLQGSGLIARETSRACKDLPASRISRARAVERCHLTGDVHPLVHHGPICWYRGLLEPLGPEEHADGLQPGLRVLDWGACVGQVGDQAASKTPIKRWIPIFFACHFLTGTISGPKGQQPDDPHRPAGLQLRVCLAAQQHRLPVKVTVLVPGVTKPELRLVMATRLQCA